MPHLVVQQNNKLQLQNGNGDWNAGGRHRICLATGGGGGGEEGIPLGGVAPNVQEECTHPRV